MRMFAGQQALKLQVINETNQTPYKEVGKELAVIGTDRAH